MANISFDPLTGVRLQALPPLSLYVHIPWCIRKCPYCDFNSHEQKGGLQEARYIDALTSDLDYALPNIWGRKVYSIFFGGGTPSLFSAEGIDRVLANIRARVSLDPDAEITLEANPGTFEFEKFRGFRAAGVNRLSIGIQSFNAAHLKALGRVHDADEARRAVEIGLAHFDNLNLDLMFALPNQTPAECEADVATAIGFAPPHLSIYHLTLEPNTLFHRFPPALPDDDLAADMQQMIAGRTAAARYGHYETSAYAQPNRQSRHNLNYWRFGDYLGIGAGAHSKISFPDRIVRQVRFKQPAQYMEAALAGNAIQEDKVVGMKELPFEFMLNALRLAEGFDIGLFEERTGLSIANIRRQLDAAESRGLVERDLARIRPTEQGRRFQNDLLELFLP
ncbi:MAG: oxygen-independent coproporphyrinogen III oxidase-like protein [Betaproteobacteria bacterium]|nr:oxygen-independent coproporphyrinogen III oxidase-like protein [Betaproteobacteria bacterium]